MKFLIGSGNHSRTAGVHVLANGSNKVDIVNSALVVAIEELKDTFKLRGSKHVPVLSQPPGELNAVQLVILALVDLPEHNAEAADAVVSPRFKSLEHLVYNLVRRLAHCTENRVHVWVVAAAHESHDPRKLFIVNLAVSV